ncbi:hypothetical protein Gotur_025922, partial [Gossypium turneri]
SLLTCPRISFPRFSKGKTEASSCRTISWRESTEDCSIDGYEIPKGTRVFINVRGLGRDPNQWENPLDRSDQRVEARKEAVFGCEGTTLQPVAIWECKKKLPWSFTSSTGCPQLSLP